MKVESGDKVLSQQENALRQRLTEPQLHDKTFNQASDRISFAHMDELDPEV